MYAALYAKWSDIRTHLTVVSYLLYKIFIANYH